MNINPLPTTDANLADIHVQAADMASALRTLKPNMLRRKNQLFSLLYPVIVELLENNVTQKSILEMLQTNGLKLHPSRFKELMTAEARLHAQRSDAFPENHDCPVDHEEMS
jgi:hypothetical protein